MDFQEGGSQISHFEDANGHSKNQHWNQQIPPLLSNLREKRKILYLSHII